MNFSRVSIITTGLIVINIITQTFSSTALNEIKIKKALEALLQIYQNDIKPLETAYRYSEFSQDSFLDSVTLAKPLLLLLGPWSTGKTTFINYLLDLENSQHKLHTGAEPTTTDFVIIQNGLKYKTCTGMELVSDEKYALSSLERFGLHFLERLKGVELSSSLLELITIVDTPGILENKKQQERGYPFNEVMKWFLHRASVVYLIFDPTKMEVGSELENILTHLKDHESKVKFVLNKADTVTQQELMKVYGALFWNLAPIVHSIEPPRVYVGSFWSSVNPGHPLAQLFLDEEKTMLDDLQQTIENQVENKFSYFRRHAFLVRLHAYTIDSYLKVYHEHKSSILSNKNLWTDIYTNPNKYEVFQKLLRYPEISINDYPKSESYKQFFKVFEMADFAPLSYHCSFYGSCKIDLLTEAIKVKLPKLLQDFKNSISYCTKDHCS